MSPPWSGGRWRAVRARQQPSGIRRAWDLFLAVLILVLLGLLALRLDRTETRRYDGAAIVNDGDTMTVNGTRVRLRGIDAPELHQLCSLDGKSYACGRNARDALRAIVRQAQVTCEGWEVDRYGRLLGRCRAGAVDLNSALVEQGWAVAFGGFEAEEARARSGRLGLWAGEFEMPRRWRETHGSLVESEHDLLGAAAAWLRAIFGLD